MTQPSSRQPSNAQNAKGDESGKFSPKKVVIGLSLAGLTAATLWIAMQMRADPEEEGDEVRMPREKAPLITNSASNLNGGKEFVPRPSCDDQFPVGMLHDTSLRRLPRGTLEITNRHHYEMMVNFYAMTDNERVQAVGIEPMKAMTVKVPVGKYRVEVLTGQEWCNLETGFKEESVRVKLDGQVLISEDRIPKISFHSEGKLPKDFSSKLSVGQLDEATLRRALDKDYSERNRSLAEALEARVDSASDRLVGSQSDVARPKGDKSCGDADTAGKPQRLEVVKDGILALKPGLDGRFYVTGGVNGYPTVFSVSSTDSLVAVSQSTASRAGIRSCMQTGAAKGGGSGGSRPCIARVSEITFGGFRLRNVEVSVLSVQNADSVLGMNAFKDLKLEHGGNSIRITANPVPVIAGAL